jgi:hypothetical protein
MSDVMLLIQECQALQALWVVCCQTDHASTVPPAWLMLVLLQLTEQLARAQLLLQEHKAAKRLKGMLVSVR